jgi:hypothetical protein
MLKVIQSSGERENTDEPSRIIKASLRSSKNKASRRHQTQIDFAENNEMVQTQLSVLIEAAWPSTFCMNMLADRITHLMLLAPERESVPA